MTATTTDTVRNGVDTGTLFATLDAIKAQPEIAAFRFRAHNRWIDGAHNRSTIKGFYAACAEDTSRSEAFTVDAGEPAILLGTDTGPTPPSTCCTRSPPASPRRGFPGLPGHVRRASGPGWALVGDAGYFKDPLTAHGITDALRDAELLARAVLAAPPGPVRDAALHDYEDTRDRLSAPLFAITERIASYRWDLAELRDLLPSLSAAMRPEVAALRALDEPAAAGLLV